LRQLGVDTVSRGRALAHLDERVRHGLACPDRGAQGRQELIVSPAVKHRGRLSDC